MKRSGFADLPLHGGRVPPWLSERMTRLGTAIVETILYHHGHSELLSRLADPFWFQALGSVMGMDWHSSGITTSVMGALKRGLAPKADELGIYILTGDEHGRLGNSPRPPAFSAQSASLTPGFFRGGTFTGDVAEDDAFQDVATDQTSKPIDRINSSALLFLTIPA